MAERWRGRVGGLRDRDPARAPTSRVVALGVFGRSGVGWFVVIDYANRDSGGALLWVQRPDEQRNALLDGVAWRR